MAGRHDPVAQGQVFQLIGLQQWVLRHGDTRAVNGQATVKEFRQTGEKQRRQLRARLRLRGNFLILPFCQITGGQKAT
jgi:hypothetical protein